MFSNLLSEIIVLGSLSGNIMVLNNDLNIFLFPVRLRSTIFYMMLQFIYKKKKKKKKRSIVRFGLKGKRFIIFYSIS